MIIVCSLDNARSSIMGSIDVESLFTNIPLDESIDIILERLFADADQYLGLNRQAFKILLQLAVKDCHFTFNSVIYKQIDGVAMGNPLGPIFANIFLAHYEVAWLENCPMNIKLHFYRRYVDDTFLLFSNKAQKSQFCNYLNKKHPNMRFTFELESDSDFSLPFLGTFVHRRGDYYQTSTYRKPTFSGLYTHFESCVPMRYKTGLIQILLFRAFKLCSSYELLHSEFDKIRSILFSNGYAKPLIDKIIKRFLWHKFQPPTKYPTAERLEVTVVLPFVGHYSLILRKNLHRFISKAYPHIRLRTAFTSIERLGSRFRVKDIVPKSLMSNIVYRFNCGGCNAAYVGQTRRHLGIRRQEHMGISFRTGKPVQSSNTSAINQHILDTGHQPTEADFKIIDTATSLQSLLIKEALHITSCKPSLNQQVDYQSLVLLQ